MLPTGTVTFLLSGFEPPIDASSQEDGWIADAVARHDDVLNKAITAHHGVRVVADLEPGTVAVVFERPSGAVAAAFDAQCALKASLASGRAPIRVRMAVHSGEVVARGEGDYAGITLQRCDQLRAGAQAGQVVVSMATAELVLDRLPEGAALVDLGVRQLTDLSRPERVYQLVHSELSGESPTLRSLEIHWHNLPYQMTPLIGRDDDLESIASALDADRLVTLTGSAGIGKTRLALHAAAERVERHPDGVALVELATVTDMGAVASAVAGVLRVWETTTEPTVAAIARFVTDRRVLAVLDNCEHVIDAAAELAAHLLGACPSLTILATSREPLSVPGEVVWRVPSLPTPPVGLPMDVSELSTFDAVRLFGDRARRARPGFALTQTNAAAVAEICSRLDGIPLALELAAARCRAMTPNQIAEGLDRRFLVLTGRGRTVVPRQQTLLASIDWSHDLLTPDERVVFRRLGAFTGPFPVEAAEAVCGEPDDPGDVFDVLSRVTDKSLVVHDADTGWYRQLETIRLYALDRCRDAGELPVIRQRHAVWWAAWLEAHHPDAPSDNDLDAIDDAYPNLRAALHWAVTTEPELALELAGGLGIYWYLRGLLGDAVALGDLALASAERGPLWARAVGRMARPRDYAHDSNYMTITVPEACGIAERSGDRLTPLRCRLTRTLTVEDVEEFRTLARVAESCGDLWHAVRMNFCVAHFDVLLDTPDAPIALEQLTEWAEELDADSLRFAVHHVAAERLAACLNVREAITRLDHAIRLADRASPTIALGAFSNLAWYGQLCGDPTPIEQVTSVLRREPRDWGVQATLASVLQQLPDLLDGTRRWDGGELVLPSANGRTVWLFADAIGEERVTLFPAATTPDAGDIARYGGLVMTARAAFREGRFRDAAADVASLVRAHATDRHFWLLMLARCAAGAGSHLEGARLLGAVEATQTRFGLPWLPRILIAARMETERLCRDALGDNRFDAAYADGGELELDAAVAFAVRARGERKRPSIGWNSLTPTELQVVEQVVAGRTNPEIANALLMGRTTVKTHLGHIFTKLGIKNRSELAAEAARRGTSRSG